MNPLLEDPSNKSLTAERALNKLIDTSQVIERRMGVRDVEGKRINEALRLLARGKVTQLRGFKQQLAYLDFLRRTRGLVGNPGVALCAVGLGQSAIANMKHRARVDLPFILKQREDITQNDHLRKVTDFYLGNVLSRSKANTTDSLC